MKTYQKNEIKEIQAVQYGVDSEAKKLVSLCQKYDGKIYKVPSDLMGKPKDAFTAVQNGDEWQLIKEGDEWQLIKEGDWIVKKDNDLIVIPNGLFKLFFEEKK